MFVLLEAIAIASILGIVTIFFRAAKARPDEPSLKWVARIALAGWAIFAAVTLIDFDAIRRDPWQVVNTMVSILVIGACVLGYRHLLGRLKAMAAERDQP